MRRKWLRLAAAALLALAVLAGCGKVTRLQEAAKGLTEYRITAELNVKEMTVTASQRVDWVNRSRNAVSELQFALYANGFREDAKYRPVTAEQVPRAYPNGPSWGGIAVSGVTADGHPVPVHVGGEDENALLVPLGKLVYPDERAVVELEYTVKLANVNHRLGYGKHTINLGNWYPVACVWGEGGYRAYPYYANGDPFYSETANYRVEFTLPAGYTLAATGNLTDSRVEDGKQTLRYEADCVRDFALVASDSFRTLQKKTGNVTVRYYYFGDAQPQESLETAARAVETFSAAFGEYPYAQLSVVEADFLQGGMEYPNLIYVSGEASGETYREIVAHETAHQWWYGVVGNDEVAYAWLDEGLTEFSTAYFYAKNPDYGRTLSQFEAAAKLSYRSYLKLLLGMELTPDTSMDRGANEFKNEYEYVTMTYSKGQLLFHDLYRMLGDEKFIAGLKLYYDTFQFSNAVPDNLIGCFEKASGRALAGWFDSWLSGKVVL